MMFSVLPTARTNSRYETRWLVSMGRASWSERVYLGERLKLHASKLAQLWTAHGACHVAGRRTRSTVIQESVG